MKDKTIKNAMNDIDKIIRDVYSQGYNDGIEFSNEAHGSTGDYEHGLNDAWECVKKIFDMDGDTAKELFGDFLVDHISRQFTASEAIAKIKEYEEKQKRTCDTCQYLHGGFNSLKNYCVNCDGCYWTPKQEERGCKTCAYSEHGEDESFKCHAKGDCLNHEKWASKMTLDEAIKHCEDVADSKCDECGVEHRQLAEWLKELKQLREQTTWIPVSERPPEIDDEVIAYDGADAFVAWYGVNGWHSTDNRFDPRVPIIKWKPINLPKAEEKTNDSCWKEYYESKFMKKV